MKTGKHLEKTHDEDAANVHAEDATDDIMFSSYQPPPFACLSVCLSSSLSLLHQLLHPDRENHHKGVMILP